MYERNPPGFPKVEGIDVLRLAPGRDKSADGSLPLRFWGDLGEVAPPDRLIKRLLGASSLAVLFGEPGCGKTFLAADMGLHIALGREWFGRPVTPGAVLYVASESVAGLNNRLAGFKAKHRPGDDVPFAIVPAAINLGPGGRDVDRVIAAATAVESRAGIAVQLIVVDTLARCMGAGDENSTQDMGSFIAACDRIRLGTGAAVLIVHHSGKNGAAGARGSTALQGAADTVIQVEKRDGGRAARVVKQKDGDDNEEIGFDLDVVEIGQDDDGEAITTCVVRPCDEVAKARPKLSPKNRRALDVLNSTLVDKPEQRPNTGTFPNVPLTKLSAWRNALKTAGVTSRDNLETERKQFGRITEKLDEMGLIRMHGDYVWNVRDKVGHAGTR